MVKTARRSDGVTLERIDAVACGAPATRLDDTLTVAHLRAERAAERAALRVVAEAAGEDYSYDYSYYSYSGLEAEASPPPSP